MKISSLCVAAVFFVSLTMGFACTPQLMQQGNADQPREIGDTKPTDGKDKGKPVPRTQLDAKAYYERALRAASYGDAIQEYTKALELDPDLADAYIGRGDAYAGMGNAKEAVKDYSRYLELKPKDIFAYYKRAAAYSYSGDYQGCIEDWNRVITKFPQEANLYDARGTCYELLGNKDQAIEDYKTASRLGYGPARKELESRGIQW